MCEWTRRAVTNVRAARAHGESWLLGCHVDGDGNDDGDQSRETGAMSGRRSGWRRLVLVGAGLSSGAILVACAAALGMILALLAVSFGWISTVVLGSVTAGSALFLVVVAALALVALASLPLVIAPA